MAFFRKCLLLPAFCDKGAGVASLFPAARDFRNSRSLMMIGGNISR
jgi:hypothetical protein